MACDKVCTLQFENEDYIMSSWLWPVYFMVSFYLFCVFLWMFSDFDGVERRILFYDKEYTWNDVDYFTLQKGTDGFIDYVVVMKDGIRCKCLGNDIGSYSLSEDRYPNETEDYCIELTEKFVEMGIPLTDTDFDKLHDRLIEYWSDYLEKIEEVIKDN